MKKILVLTKNILSEQELQEKLQYLNYEVFCSVTQFTELMKKNYCKMASEFPIIIFSNTIQNQEIQEIIEPLKRERHIFLRKLDTEPSLKANEQLSSLEISGWISDKTTVDQLRECLYDQNRLLIDKIDLESSAGKCIVADRLFLARFRQRELKILKKLADNQGQIISREELCIFVWENGANRSNLSQLSVLIKKIKRKLADFGIDPSILETVWKKGYRLNQEIIFED